MRKRMAQSRIDFADSFLAFFAALRSLGVSNGCFFTSLLGLRSLAMTCIPLLSGLVRSICHCSSGQSPGRSELQPQSQQVSIATEIYAVLFSGKVLRLKKHIAFQELVAATVSYGVWHEPVQR